MKKAVLVTFNNFTDIDIYLAWDLLNRVKKKDKAFAVKIVGDAPNHTSTTGINLATQGTLAECNDADLVFFGSGIGVRDVIKDKNFLEQFNLNPEKQLICSMCSGSLIIAALGHLKGLSATTYPSTFAMLREFGVDVVEDKHLVVQGNIATAAGCLAAVDLMSWAIERLYDEEMREAIIASVMPIGQGQVCLY